MADHEWDEVIYLGDFMDFGCISSHNKENLRAIAGKTIWRDYDIGVEILARHQKLAPKAKFTLIEGNHEHRMERYIDANPQLDGMIEVELGLELIKRKVKWVRFWSKGEIYKIGKARFIHGNYTTKYHAAKHADAYGDNVFYGHTHDVQSYSKELHGDDKTIVAQSLGCLCRYDQPYMRGKPSKWQQAFGIFYFQPNGFFTYYVPRIFKHGFISPEGKVYQG
jgi:predicted phosphodiesterase